MQGLEWEGPEEAFRRLRARAGASGVFILRQSHERAKLRASQDASAILHGSATEASGSQGNRVKQSDLHGRHATDRHATNSSR